MCKLCIILGVTLIQIILNGISNIRSLFDIIVCVKNSESLIQSCNGKIDNSFSKALLKRDIDEKIFTRTDKAKSGAKFFSKPDGQISNKEFSVLVKRTNNNTTKFQNENQATEKDAKTTNTKFNTLGLGSKTKFQQKNQTSYGSTFTNNSKNKEGFKIYLNDENNKIQNSNKLSLFLTSNISPCFSNTNKPGKINNNIFLKTNEKHKEKNDKIKFIHDDKPIDSKNDEQNENLDKKLDGKENFDNIITDIRNNLENFVKTNGFGKNN